MQSTDNLTKSVANDQADPAEEYQYITGWKFHDTTTAQVREPANSVVSRNSEHFDAQTEWLPLLLHIALGSFLRVLNSQPYEPELVQVGGQLQIPPVYECDVLNQKVHELTSDSTKEKRFGGTNIQLTVRQPGLPDTLYWEEAQIEANFRYLQSGSDSEKVVIEIDPDKEVSVSSPSRLNGYSIQKAGANGLPP
ncbi:hypothetical protein HD806DRAFT_530481 [Xylariaceae sp. AK1471]|nr:hypothetical protein HD806DRAFT_530481 [Xylariaceae sp. AK1471]